MSELYTVGIDFGTLSCRAVLAAVTDGRILSASEELYAHGIITHTLPDGTALTGCWALQDPTDYLDVLYKIVPNVVRAAGVAPSSIAGLGVDFTCSTVVPLDTEFRPMCLDKRFRSHPHAWVKLWKDHGASSQARRLTNVSRTMGLPYADWYGESISPECLTAKVLQVYEEDRTLYEATRYFIEAGDYITSVLAGEPVFGRSAAAAKAIWSMDGYPGPEFFNAVAPGAGDMPQKKLIAGVPEACGGFPGEKVGTLCTDLANRLGLCPGIAICAPQLDGYAAMPGLGLTQPGELLMVVGTSTGMLLLSECLKPVKGITASLPNTFYPGLYGYASGQASVGDTFQWFLDSCLPQEYSLKAAELGLSVHTYLSLLTEKYRPGQTGLLALDWFNGNRSCIANPRLSGAIIGLRLDTRPEEIYRALLEATAFGARAIWQEHLDAGLKVEKVVACGGVAVRNPTLMQIYADVFQQPLYVRQCAQAPALGSAVAAASAAGIYPDLRAAACAMGSREERVFAPCPQNAWGYSELYRVYRKAAVLLGEGSESIMEALYAMAHGRTDGKQKEL